MIIYRCLDVEEEDKVIEEQYNQIDGISVDFGIMQKTRKAYVVKCEFVWDDIGSYAALSRFLSSNRGNNITGKVFTEQSENCSIFAKDRLVIGFGLKDLVIVDTGDVVLVMDKYRDQEIKYLVNKLKNEEEFNDYLQGLANNQKKTLFEVKTLDKVSIQVKSCHTNFLMRQPYFYKW